MCTFDGPRTATTDIFCEIKLTEKKLERHSVGRLPPPRPLMWQIVKHY